VRLAWVPAFGEMASGVGPTDDWRFSDCGYTRGLNCCSTAYAANPGNPHAMVADCDCIVRKLVRVEMAGSSPATCGRGLHPAMTMLMSQSFRCLVLLVFRNKRMIHRCGSARGFTLFEMMVVLVILAMAMTVVPSIMAGLEGSRLRAASDNLVARLRETRSEALRRYLIAELVLDTRKRTYATPAARGVQTAAIRRRCRRSQASEPGAAGWYCAHSLRSRRHGNRGADFPAAWWQLGRHRCGLADRAGAPRWIVPTIAESRGSGYL